MSAEMTFYVASPEYIKPLNMVLDDAPYTGDYQMAFVPGGRGVPADSDFATGPRLSSSLGAGLFAVYIRKIDAPEKPAAFAGYVRIL